MAAPIPKFGPRIEVALTRDMTAAIDLAAAREAVSRSEWIRLAAEERLARQDEET